MHARVPFLTLAGLLLANPLLASQLSASLQGLVAEGPELHASLVTQQIDEVDRLHLPRAVLHGNPQLSSDVDFVKAIARSGTQGRHDSDGVRAALYALYRAEKELGFYGLEAASVADADRIELRLREIWALNASLDRARVHRGGNVLVVVWTDGVSAACWEAVNEEVARRLSGG